MGLSPRLSNRRAFGLLARGRVYPCSKKRKLPYKTEKVTYALEYGEDTVEIHVDAFQKGEKVLIVDDLLATGGTAKATCDLVEKTEVR